MENSMIDRVARVLGTNIHPRGTFSDAQLKTLAEAAIRAMMEPTKEMIVAGDDAKESCVDSDWDSDADGNRHNYTAINSDLPAIVFRAMILAALSSPPSKS